MRSRFKYCKKEEQFLIYKVSIAVQPKVKVIYHRKDANTTC